jgi:hypothetical protein
MAKKSRTPKESSKVQTASTRAIQDQIQQNYPQSKAACKLFIFEQVSGGLNSLLLSNE